MFEGWNLIVWVVERCLREMGCLGSDVRRVGDTVGGDGVATSESQKVRRKKTTNYETQR